MSEAQDPRRALLLGGRGAIGAAIGARLRAAGMAVAAPGSDALDLADAVAVERFARTPSCEEVDVLVYAAGINAPRPYHELRDPDVARLFDVNLFSFLRIARQVVPAMARRGYGRVLGISSIYGSFARPGRLAYTMSKHAMNGALKNLALEVGESGVVVNTLSPGFIDTPMTHRNNPPRIVAALVRRIPLGRLGTPQDIAEVATFLCSEQNRYIHGQDIVVDGGFSAGGFQRFDFEP